MKKKWVLLLIVIATAGCVTSGCSKDEILDGYNSVIKTAGNVVLTDSRSLKGKRSYGADHYVGTYEAIYSDFSGMEYVFGGTSIERDLGDEVEIRCDFDVKGGVVRLIVASGSDDPKTFFEGHGTYSDTVVIPAGSIYMGVECDDFTGSVYLEVR